ncbi:MAG: hypothetical protein ACLPY1_07315 [Terracidiphilus sp.]
MTIGEKFAVTLGMLRITSPTASGSGVFVLEGKLTGLWAQELLRVARGENRRQGNIFDLQEVFYVDSAGEEALRILGSAYGASFITESAYGKDLCKRLKLRRVSIAEVENINAQVRECSPTPRSRRAADVNMHNSLTGTAEKQHPSRCGE